MVKIAVSGFVLGGFLVGTMLAKGAAEELIYNNFAIITPKTGLIIGAAIIFLSWMRLKKKL